MSDGTSSSSAPPRPRPPPRPVGGSRAGARVPLPGGRLAVGGHELSAGVAKNSATPAWRCRSRSGCSRRPAAGCPPSSRISAANTPQRAPSSASAGQLPGVGAASRPRVDGRCAPAHAENGRPGRGARRLARRGGRRWTSGVHLPLADLDEGIPTGKRLRDYTTTVATLCFRTVAANDHLVW